MDGQDFESRCENCIIKQLNALKTFKKEELKKISDSKISKKVKKGEQLFEEGENLNGVYCVRNGVSKLSKLNSNGKDQTVKIAGKGEVLGQRSIIAQERANLSAVALDDMEVCFIPKSLIAENLENNSEYTQTLLKQMASDLGHADRSLIDMAQKSVEQRLAKTLLYIEEEFGCDNEGFLKLVLSRADFANILGTATELCIRMLAKFKRQGLIATEGKRIKNVDKKRMRKMIQ